MNKRAANLKNQFDVKSTLSYRSVKESFWAKQLGKSVPFSLLTMTDEILKECTFAPRTKSFEEAQSVIANSLLPRLEEQITGIETAKKLPEYNVVFSVDVALHINKMMLIDPDRRSDEQYLTADAEEPVSLSILFKGVAGCSKAG